MENNLLWKYFRKVSEVFLPTPFARRATGQILSFRAPGQISTHALRTEGDIRPQLSLETSYNFYPRPPHGGTTGRATRQHFYPRPPHGWRHKAEKAQAKIPFLSTPSTRRATVSRQRFPLSIGISTNALHAEGDSQPSTGAGSCRDFYPHPHAEGDSGFGGLSWRLWDFYPRPYTEGDQKKKSSAVFRRISSHTLRIEGDRWASSGVISPGSFLPTPSTWRATMTSINEAKSTRNFYPRPPHGGRQKSTIGVNHSLQTAVLFPRDSNRRFVETTHADWVQAQPASRRQATCARTLIFNYQKPTTRLGAASCRLAGGAAD